MPNVFDRLSQEEANKKSDSQPENVFYKLAKETPKEALKEESSGKSAARTLAQIPLGIGSAHPGSYIPGIISTVLSLGASGRSKEELLNQIEMSQDYPELNPSFDIDVAKKRRKEGIEEFSRSLPTQQNLERVIEEKTGLPLEPKNKAQSLLRLGSEAASFRTGSIAEKGKAALTAPTASAALQELGVPEGLADFLGLGLSQLSLKKPKEAPSFEQRLASDVGKPPLESEFERGSNLQKSLNEIPSDISAQKPILPQGLPKSQSDLSSKNIKPRQNNVFLDVQLRPVGQEKSPSIENRVGRIFSPEKAYNSHEGGYLVKNALTQASDRAYQQVNNLYSRSRELNQGIESIQPNLANVLLEQEASISRIPDPSNTQRSLRTSINNILDSLVTRDPNGRVSGYRPIDNQVLIDQLQSLRQKTDLDFSHGEARNIFRPSINAIQDAVVETARQANPEAARVFNEARRARAQWADIYDNDFVSKIRDPSNESYEKIFKSEMNADNFNQSLRGLEATEEGQRISKAIVRQMVEEKLDPLLKKGRKASKEELDSAIRELESVITPEQAREVKRTIETHGLRRKGSLSEQQKAAPISKEEATVSKYLKMSPEKLSQKADSISGLREIGKELKKAKNGEEVFSKFKEDKGLNAIYEGRITPSGKVENIQKMLNDVDKRAYLEETLGKEKVFRLEKIVESESRIQSILEGLKKTDPKIFSTETWTRLIGPKSIFKALTNPRILERRKLKRLLKEENMKILEEIGEKPERFPVEAKSKIILDIRKLTRDIE